MERVSEKSFHPWDSKASRKSKINLSKACQSYGISRQAIYQQRKRDSQKQKQLAPIKDMVLDERRHLPRLGTRKLYYRLKERFKQSYIKLGRDGLFAYLKAHNLLITPKRCYTKTTYSKHWMRKHPNLLKDMKVDRAEKAFVSDITYVESEEGVHYLSLVTDAYSRKIMGYELADNMRASDTVKALNMAVKNRVTKHQAIPLRQRHSILFRAVSAVLADKPDKAVHDGRLRLQSECIGGTCEWHYEARVFTV